MTHLALCLVLCLTACAEVYAEPLTLFDVEIGEREPWWTDCFGPAAGMICTGWSYNAGWQGGNAVITAADQAEVLAVTFADKPEVCVEFEPLAPRLCFTRDNFPLCSVPVLVPGARAYYVRWEPEPDFCPKDS